MDNKSNEQLLVIQSANEANTDEKIENATEDLKSMITLTITSMMDQINISKSSPDHEYSPKCPYPNTLVLANRRAPPLGGKNSTKIGGIWTLKHEISSQKYYELLIKK